MLIKLVARLTQPALTALHPGDDRLWIEHERHALCLGCLHLRVLAAFTLARELLFGFAQRSAPTLTRSQMLGQLIAARIAVELILGSVDLARLLQDLPGELLVIEVAVMRGVRVHLRPIDRDHPDLHEARLPAEPQHLAEQARQRRLVAHTKARDRRVIGRQLASDHAVGDILHAATLDPPRGALAPRVRVHQQRHHHRRLKRRAAPPILAIGAIERREIHLLHRRQHEPREMVLR